MAEPDFAEGVIIGGRAKSVKAVVRLSHPHIKLPVQIRAEGR